jgi:hypothetical protein
VLEFDWNVPPLREKLPATLRVVGAENVPLLRVKFPPRVSVPLAESVSFESVMATLISVYDEAKESE